MGISPTIDRLLVTEPFQPEVSRRPNEVLVMGNELAADLRRPDGQLSHGGQLAQAVANQLGVLVFAYMRLGTEGPHSRVDRAEIYTALADERVEETVADIGRVLRKRIRDHQPYARIAAVGKSWGALYGPLLTKTGTLNALAGAYVEPAGLHLLPDAPRTRLVRALWAHRRHPGPMLHIIRDETYHGHIAASNVLLDGLFYATAPSYVEVAERGQYGKVLETDKLVDKLDQYPHVTARMRPDVSHDWYRDPAAYATALEDGLVAIDYWQDQRKIF